MDDGIMPGRKGRAGQGRRLRYTDELGEQVAGLVRAGHSFSRIAKTPGMPTHSTIWQWRQQHAAFDRAITNAQRQARLHQRALDRVRDGGALLRPKPYDHRQSDYTPELAERICTRLANGESLIAICRDDDMPAPATIYRWVRRIPEFTDMYVDARQMQGDYLFDEAREVALSATPANVWARRLHFDIIRWETSRLAPNKYCERMMVIEAQAQERFAPMTVVVKRFTDPPEDKPQTPEEREALRVGKVVWSNEPGVKPGDLMPD